MSIHSSASSVDRCIWPTTQSAGHLYGHCLHHKVSLRGDGKYTYVYRLSLQYVGCGLEFFIEQSWTHFCKQDSPSLCVHCSARVIKPLGKRTVFRGIWLIILFVYKYIADTVANILKCVALVGDNVGSRYSQIVSAFNVVPQSLGHNYTSEPHLLISRFMLTYTSCRCSTMMAQFHATQANTWGLPYQHCYC